MSVHIFKDERDKPNIEILGQDRGRNIQYGRRIDNPKIKVVKIGLSVPEVPKGHIEIQTTGKKPIEYPMNSYNRNWYNRMGSSFLGQGGNIFGSTGGVGYMNIRKATDGTYYNNGTTNTMYGLDSESIDNNYNYGGAFSTKDCGIVIGSSDTAFDFDGDNITYKLTTFTHGVADGNIFHTYHAVPVVSFSSPTWKVINQRFFDNLGTTTINNIKESGLYIKCSNPCLEERHVLPSIITLLAKQGLRVKYTRTWDIPLVIGDWTRNALNIWLSNGMVCNHYCATASFGAGYRTLKDTAGTLHRSYATVMDETIPYMCASGNSWHGILVGTDNTGESLEDFALTGKVAHSAAVTYADVLRDSYTWTLGSLTFSTTYSRILTNISSGDVVIREIGLVVLTDLSYTYLMSRKVLASPVTLANGESLQVIYNISQVLPE